MPRRDSEEDDAASPSPRVTTPTKAICNGGAGHGSPDAKEINCESYANIEKEFNESTGMLACEMFSTFVCNDSIQASLFSTIFCAYVMCAIMTHFSNRLFALQVSMASSEFWHTTL